MVLAKLRAELLLLPGVLRIDPRAERPRVIRRNAFARDEHLSPGAARFEGVEAVEKPPAALDRKAQERPRVMARKGHEGAPLGANRLVEEHRRLEAALVVAECEEGTGAQLHLAPLGEGALDGVGHARTVLSQRVRRRETREPA